MYRYWYIFRITKPFMPASFLRNRFMPHFLFFLSFIFLIYLFLHFCSLLDCEMRIALPVARCRCPPATLGASRRVAAYLFGRWRGFSLRKWLKNYPRNLAFAFSLQSERRWRNIKNFAVAYQAAAKAKLPSGLRLLPLIPPCSAVVAQFEVRKMATSASTASHFRREFYSIYI